MFRPMRRFKQQVSDEKCIEILRNEKRGALAMTGEEGYPYCIPVNFYYEEDDGKIYIHGAKEGHKIDSIKADNKVCFTVWNQGFIKEGAWEYNPTSVVCRGTAELITNPELTYRESYRLAAKYYPTLEGAKAEADKDAHKVQLIAITIEHMTGKLVNEK